MWLLAGNGHQARSIHVLQLTADHTSLLQSIDESCFAALGSVREVCLTERAGLVFIRRFSFLTHPDVPEADFWPMSFSSCAGRQLPGCP